MKKIKTILFVAAVCAAAGLTPGYALEQGEPVDALSMKEIPFFEYDLRKKTGPQKYVLKLPVALETEGLCGPLPQDNPVAAWFWEKYKDAGFKRAIEYDSRSGKYYQTPFMRITAIQKVGTPVKIKLLAPEPEEIIMPLSGPGGKAGERRYRVTQRFFSIRTLDSEGDIVIDEDKAKISLIENDDMLEISWIPSLIEEKYGPELTAPVVIEIILRYRIKSEVIIDDKIHDGWTREGWAERRVAWIAMPFCGQAFGEDDEPIVCPAVVAPAPPWKNYSLGPVSLQVPENWESRIGNGNGRFEIGDGLAGITIVREKGAEKQLQHLQKMTQKNVEVTGLSAVEYKGLAKKGKMKARMIIFKNNLSDGRPLAVATALKDDRYAGILEASFDSVTIDQGVSQTPAIPPIPAPHIPELPDLGKGEYSFFTDGRHHKKYDRAEYGDHTVTPDKSAPVKVKPPAATDANPPGQDSDSGRLKLKRLKGFSDFAGRNESLQGNGSPDSRLSLEIEAPGQIITRLDLRNAGDKTVIWDTAHGNSTWLMVITRKNKVVNQADGSVRYALGNGKEKLDLWLQDNHTLAAGKTELELVISFDNNKSLVIPMER